MSGCSTSATSSKNKVYWGPLVQTERPYVSPRAIGGFEAGNLGAGHIVLSVDDYEASLRFYRDGLGLLISDFIELDMGGAGTTMVAFLHCGPRHHSLYQAEAADSYAGCDQSRDHTGRWQDLPRQHILDCQWALPHLRAHSLPYYLPALMSFAVRGHDQERADHGSRWIFESIEYHLQLHLADGSLRAYQQDRHRQLNQMEPFYPLHVYVCENCYLVQLEEYVSPENIFTEYAYFSSYAVTWLQHAENYTNSMIERFRLNNKSFVVEVASNDGYLLQYFVQKNIPVLGIEPAKNVAKVAVEKGVPTLTEFFGVKLAERLCTDGKQADLIAGNNVLAQVPDINDFVGGLKILLKPAGVITIEFPHLMDASGSP